ncbi:MAG: hypothetical protein HYZ72_21185 [Deltaproteobacteria bacterium]|nr:hypothetical protein [Deltaproteobacteria bacterium]
MRIRRFFHLVLLLLAGVVGWQVVATWTFPSPEVNPLSPLPDQAGTGEETLLHFPFLDEGRRLATVIVDKDLFSPGRQRRKEETVVPASVPPPTHLKLVGILRLSGQEEAFFTDAQQGGKVVRVQVGEEIGQYRLTRAEDNSVTLAFPNGGEGVSLSLAVQRGEEATKAPRMPSPQPQATQTKGQRLPQPALASPPPSAQRAVTGEEQVLRQQIQQLHQRLRDIRRQGVEGKSG